MRPKNYIHLIVVISAIVISGAIWHHPRYIRTGDVDYKSIIGPPPAPGSIEATQDMYKVLGMQAIRKPADISRAQSEVYLSPFVFSRVLGPWFSADNLPQTAVLLREVMEETGRVVDPAKEFYARPRPFVANPDVIPCVKKEENFSYPSGHAAGSMIVALVLAEIFPDQRQDLIDEAKTIGADRVFGGVHYFSDVQAGQKLAQAIFDRLQQSESFKDQLQHAKIECEFHPHDARFHVASAE